MADWWLSGSNGATENKNTQWRWLIFIWIFFPGYTDSTIAVIIVYCVLFVIAAGGNLSVVITLFRSRRHRRSRVSLMICHLAVADLMVAFIVIPLEVITNIINILFCYCTEVVMMFKKNGTTPFFKKLFLSFPRIQMFSAKHINPITFLT